MKVIKMPSIDQYHHTVVNINHLISYTGRDENDLPVYDYSIPKPIITFTGTIKLHGTNASIGYDGESIWPQSKTSIISINKDNAGFAFYVETHAIFYEKLLKSIANDFNVNLETHNIAIYGEWCGKGIQKNVAISLLSNKTFFFFGVKVAPKIINSEAEPENYSVWLDISTYKLNNSIENRFYNLYNFKTYQIDIDFNCPELMKNKIIDMTIEVENECPVGKAFDISGIGEGIVFSTFFKGNKFTFKSKGEKHSKSKVKTINAVDDAKINLCLEIADKVTPSWRLEQMLNETFDLKENTSLPKEKIGVYIKSVINDIIKEDLYILAEANLEIKDVSKYISNIARNYFFNYFS